MDLLARKIEYNKDIDNFIKTQPSSTDNILEGLNEKSSRHHKKQRIEKNKKMQKLNQKSMNSIQKDVVAIEYLEHLSKTNKKLFDKLVDRKKYLSDFNNHYKQMKGRERTANKKLDIMKKVYGKEKECTFSPVMNKNSRKIISQSPSLNRSITSLVYPKKAIKKDRSANLLMNNQPEDRNFSFKKKPGKQGSKKFNPVRFNNHMQRLKEWDERSKSKRVKRLLQGFVERTENNVNKEKKKFKGFGSSKRDAFNNTSTSYNHFKAPKSQRDNINYFDNDRSFHRIPNTKSMRNH